MVTAQMKIEIIIDEFYPLTAREIAVKSESVARCTKTIPEKRCPH
jgi:hypothetical protein